jgi:transcriptional regulator with XRE-family HTH domain
MSTGERIILFRQKRNLTKTSLASKSGLKEADIEDWEDGRRQPSMEQLGLLARVLGIRTQDLVGDGSSNTSQGTSTVVNPDTYNPTNRKPLGYCCVCHKPIYEESDLIKTSHHGQHRTYCKSCREAARERLKESEHGLQAKWRVRSFVYGGLITAAILTITLIIMISNGASGGVITLGTFLSLFFFPFISCLFLRNNCVLDLVMSVGTWGFVRMPGIIFSLDFDGLIFLITTKIILFLISITIAVFCFAFAIVLGYVVSLFVYPFALANSYSHPEKFY